MHFKRQLENSIQKSIDSNPVTAILDPRQCGKSTLAKQLLKRRKNTICLDLERPSDIQKLHGAEWFLSRQKGKLICLDEIQRLPEIFPLIRSLVDERGSNEINSEQLSLFKKEYYICTRYVERFEIDCNHMKKTLKQSHFSISIEHPTVYFLMFNMLNFSAK